MPPGTGLANLYRYVRLSFLVRRRLLVMGGRYIAPAVVASVWFQDDAFGQPMGGMGMMGLPPSGVFMMGMGGMGLGMAMGFGMIGMM